MAQSRFVVFAILFVRWVRSQGITVSFQQNAVTPTASGQIGVNPVTDVGPDVYLNIGPNTQWYQSDGSTTKWIGVNTEYLTDVAYTTTVGNQPTVTNIPAAIVATTATATGDGGLIPGDVSVAFSPKLVDTLKSLAAEAESACSIRRRRTTCNVNERFAQRVFEELSPGGRLGFIDTGILATIPTVNGPQIASILRNAEILPTAGIGIFLLWQIKGQLSAWTMAPGSDSTVGGGDDDDDDDGCPEDAPKGVDAPICTDADCKGDNTQRNQKCSQGSWKGCDCLATAEVNSAIVGDTNLYDNGKTWLDEQQQLIDALIDERPFCIHGASPRGDRIPRGYCNCGDDEKTLTYSEAKSTTSPYNACPYTTDNGPTVTFQTASTMTTRSTPSASPIVTCSEPRERWFSSTDGYDFASQFCNRGEGEVLMPRPASGFASAYEQSFNVDKDPLVSIFAYLDDSCQSQGITHLNGEECAMALDSIMHDCDTNTEEKKMGGSVSIGCQWFSIMAFKGPGCENPTDMGTCIPDSGGK